MSATDDPCVCPSCGEGLLRSRHPVTRRRTRFQRRRADGGVAAVGHSACLRCGGTGVGGLFDDYSSFRRGHGETMGDSPPSSRRSVQLRDDMIGTALSPSGIVPPVVIETNNTRGVTLEDDSFTIVSGLTMGRAVDSPVSRSSRSRPGPHRGWSSDSVSSLGYESANMLAMEGLRRRLDEISQKCAVEDMRREEEERESAFVLDEERTARTQNLAHGERPLGVCSSSSQSDGSWSGKGGGVAGGSAGREVTSISPFAVPSLAARESSSFLSEGALQRVLAAPTGDGEGGTPTSGDPSAKRNMRCAGETGSDPSIHLSTTKPAPGCWTSHFRSESGDGSTWDVSAGSSVQCSSGDMLREGGGGRLANPCLASLVEDSAAQDIADAEDNLQFGGSGGGGREGRQGGQHLHTHHFSFEEYRSSEPHLASVHDKKRVGLTRVAFEDDSRRKTRDGRAIRSRQHFGKQDAPVTEIGSLSLLEAPSRSLNETGGREPRRSSAFHRNQSDVWRVRMARCNSPVALIGEDDEMLERLVRRGFDRDCAMDALREYGGNEAQALEFLVRWAGGGEEEEEEHNADSAENTEDESARGTRAGAGTGGRRARFGLITDRTGSEAPTRSAPAAPLPERRTSSRSNVDSPEEEYSRAVDAWLAASTVYTRRNNTDEEGTHHTPVAQTIVFDDDVQTAQLTMLNVERLRSVAGADEAPEEAERPIPRPTSGGPAVCCVSVPENIRPGDDFPVLVEGRVLTVRCPPRASPGTRLQITVHEENRDVAPRSDPAAEDADGEANHSPTQEAPPNEERQRNTRAINISPEEIDRLVFSPSTGGVAVYCVTIPQGIQPGDDFPVRAGDRVLTVRCPLGASPGTGIQITVNEGPMGAASRSDSVGATGHPQERMLLFRAVAPPAARPGHPFEACVEGRKVLVPCPANVAPGGTVLLRLPASLLSQ